MRAVIRLTALATPSLAVAVLVAACGAPPEPVPTAPPPAATSAAAASTYPSSYPSAEAPTNSAYPTPTGTLGLPTYPTATLPAVTIRPTTPRPSPAPRCAHGPTGTQVITVVRAWPGIPTRPELDVKQGPFCAGKWQFTVLGQAGKTLDQVEPLLVVTTGRPSALRVVEAGADVCSTHVEDAAPSGIRVLACGA
jgi:hypothetical protein